MMAHCSPVHVRSFPYGSTRGEGIGIEVDGIDLMVVARGNARVRLFRYAYGTLGLYNGGIYGIWEPYMVNIVGRVCDIWGS